MQVLIQQPGLIKEYNINMGGVDRSDQNISLYRTSIRGKKWYFPLFAHSLAMAVTNAWQLHRLYGGKMSNFDFRRSIVLDLLSLSTCRKRGPAVSRPSSTENLDCRYDGVNHWITASQQAIEMQNLPQEGVEYMHQMQCDAPC